MLIARGAWTRPRHAVQARAVLAACALALASCGDTLQDKPIGGKPLESVLVGSRFPVYWLGLRYRGMPISAVTIDPSETVTIRYGDCVIGGQYTCVTAVSIVTSPDNSFIPGGATRQRTVSLRGARARASRGGTTLAIPTAGVMVSVFADSATLARAAALTMTPLNEPGLPLAPLPAALPDTGFDRGPLPGQVPSGVSVPRGPA
jgi:hypothetical protein